MSRIQAFIDWLIPDSEPDVDAIDTEFLLSHPTRFKYMTVTDSESARCRCDLCGSQFSIQEFPKLVDHVAAHDEQGSAEIDPFDEAERRTVITDDLLDEVEDWRDENATTEVEA